MGDLKIFFQKCLAGLSCVSAVKEQMQGVKLPEIRVDAVPRAAAAQTVAAVVHRLHGVGDGFAAHPFPVPVDHRRDGAPGGDAYLTFLFHSLPVLSQKEKDAHFRTVPHTKMNAIAHLQVLYPFSCILSSGFAKNVRLLAGFYKNNCKMG